MGKRSVKVNSFFPKRIFAPDVWGTQVDEKIVEVHDENKIISKFAAKTIPSVSSSFTRGQKYVSNEQNDFSYVGNFSDEIQNTTVPNNIITPAPISQDLTHVQIAELKPTPTMDYKVSHITDHNPTSQPMPISYHMPTPTVHIEPEPYRELTSSPYQQPITIPLAHDSPKTNYEAISMISGENDITEAPVAYHEPVIHDEPAIYQAPITTHEVFYDSSTAEINHSSTISENIENTTQHSQSEYERVVSRSVQSAVEKTEEENSDFDYSAYKGHKELDQQNYSLQFNNSEFVTKQIEDIHSTKLQETISLQEKIMTHKQKILIVVASVVFIFSMATLYIAFTSGGDTPNVPVPAELTEDTSGEKPVVIVPSQNGEEPQSGYDANGNPIG
jgi:hypothetical protein